MAARTKRRVPIVSVSTKTNVPAAGPPGARLDPAIADALADAQIGIAELTVEGRIVHANHVFAHLVGRAPSRIRGAALDAVLPVEDLDRLRRLIRRAAQGGSVLGELRLLYPDGTRRWVAQRILPARGADGRTDRLLALLQDETTHRQRRDEQQTARAQLEGMVKRRTAELEGMVRELETFNYSVTHDLRTPLRSIRGFSELLLREAKRLPTDLRPHVEFIHESAARMANIIEGLLRLAKVDRHELRRQTVDVSALARQIVADMQRRNPDRKVVFEIEPHLVAQADPMMVGVLLENLLENAWKFTGKKPLARISLTADEIEERPYFVLKDNGIGFATKETEELFRPFRRLDSSQKFEGYGLGLATVRRVVTRHGGRIFAEGVPGQGATFYFTLTRWAGWG